MSVIADLIRAGVDPDLVAKVAEEMVESAKAVAPARTARQERNARYYENRKERLKASESSETVLNKTVKTVSDPESPAPFPPKDNIKPPLSPSPVEILREAVCETTAKDLVAHRKAKKSPLTPGAAKGLVKAFMAYGDPEAAASEMMAQGWTGFKPEYMRAIQPRAAPAKAEPQEIRNPALRALQRLSQKNAQRTDEQDIFAPRSGPCQPSSSAGNPGDETGAEAGRFGPVLNLAAYR